MGLYHNGRSQGLPYNPSIYDNYIHFKVQDVFTPTQDWSEFLFRGRMQLTTHALLTGLVKGTAHLKQHSY